jgi:hypothetical protein
MGDKVIKVSGYAKKEVYNGNIEYRNFSPDLVGQQLTSGNSTFTLGNFTISTTLDAKPSKIFTTNKFSNFVSLCDLNLTPEETQLLLNDNSEVRLKLDTTNINNYTYFGSFLEFVRVSLEEIITKWPASLYLSPIGGLNLNNTTVEDFTYNYLADESIFKISTNVIRNPYLINYLDNGTLVNTFNETNDIRNMSVSYLKYSLLRGETEYDVLDFTGSTTVDNDFIYFKVKGNPFTDITGTTGIFTYHIKPNKTQVDLFFNKLPDFESNLLNRFTLPKYTSTYSFPDRTDDGNLIYKTESLTWPVSDGYNIDFDSTDYIEFVSRLIEIATDFDENKTNLMARFLTAEAISDFDTVPNCDGSNEETAGQKMNRTLKVWGREFDELKRYINGIQFANTVTYNQLDNTPDVVLKYLARTMGWNVVQSILENDLLKNYINSSTSSFSGMSTGLTPIQAEIEMWRRIILNTPWIWKSKGARKSIEFFFKFIGAPDGLIEFNEFIYLAKGPIDVDQFITLLELHGLDTDLSKYPIDSDGYPRVPLNTPDMYFQKGGLWYRQTGGPNAAIDILDGNNPHIGPYDGGAAFINQFNNLIPDFSATTLTSTTVTNESTEMFTNYDNGVINGYEGEYFIDIVSGENGASLDDCVVVTTEKVPDPHPSALETTNCGCPIEEDDYALLINVGCDIVEPLTNCNNKITSIKETTDGYYIFFYKTYDQNGNEMNGNYGSEFNSRECCVASAGGTPIYYEKWTNDEPRVFVNAGYICCSTPSCGCYATCEWKLTTSNLSELPILAPYNEPFLVFTKPDGSLTTVVPNGCSCVDGLTIPRIITDPYTGVNGTGCQLTRDGITDLTKTNDYYYVNGTNQNDAQVVQWYPKSDKNGNITNQPNATIYNSWLEAVYGGKSNGDLNCSAYMNDTINGNTGVPIDSSTQATSSNTIIRG